MSIFGDLAKGGIQGLAQGIGAMAKDLREAITGKSVLSNEDIVKLETLAQQMDLAALEADKAVNLAQIELLKEDAKSTSLFKGGWRPAVGWVCACGLGFQFLVRPVAPWLLAVLGIQGIPDMPELDMGTLLTLLGGLLGLGGFRTFEKVKGVQ